jgi:multiple sugar transport system permease protein
LSNKKNRYQRKKAAMNTLAGYLFLTPALVMFIVFLGGPVVATLILSFSKYNALISPQFIGIKNFLRLFSTPKSWVIFGNTFKYVAVLVPLHAIFSLFLASMVNAESRSSLRYIYRTCIYFPSILTTSAVAIAWGFLLHKDYGVINWLLSRVGGPSIPWLVSTKWSVPAISMFSIWKWVGISFLYYLIGLQNIPASYKEAASIDGANSFQVFSHVTLPLLSPTIFFVTITQFAGCFQIFEEPYLITQGGPGNSSRTISLYIYETAFQSQDMGFAAAIAFCLFFIIFIITFIQFRLQNKWVVYDYE